MLTIGLQSSCVLANARPVASCCDLCCGYPSAVMEIPELFRARDMQEVSTFSVSVTRKQLSSWESHTSPCSAWRTSMSQTHTGTFKQTIRIRRKHGPSLRKLSRRCTRLSKAGTSAFFRAPCWMCLYHPSSSSQWYLTVTFSHSRTLTISPCSQFSWKIENLILLHEKICTRVPGLCSHIMFDDSDRMFDAVQGKVQPDDRQF